MKHFVDFGFEGRVAKGVGRNLALVGGGLLGFGAGKLLAGESENTPEKITYDSSQKDYNNQPQNPVLKRKALADYDTYINSPSAQKEKYLTLGGASLGVVGGLLLRNKYLRK